MAGTVDLKIWIGDKEPEYEPRRIGELGGGIHCRTFKITGSRKVDIHGRGQNIHTYGEGDAGGIVVTKAIDSASVALFEAFAKNKLIYAEFTIGTPDPGSVTGELATGLIAKIGKKGATEAKSKDSGAWIAGYAIHVPDTDALGDNGVIAEPLETITFAFNYIQLQRGKSGPIGEDDLLSRS